MKVKLGKNELFMAGWTLVLLYYLLIAATNFNFIIPRVGYIKWGIIGLAMLFWLIKIRADKYKPKIFFFICAFVLVNSVAALMSGKELLFVTIVFFIASKNIEIQRFIRFDFHLRLGIIVTIFSLFLLGILDDSLLIRGDLVKHSFGWLHPNTLASNVIIVLLDYLYIKWNTLKLSNWAIILATLFLLNKYVAARTTLISFSIILVWVFITHRKKINFASNKVVIFLVSNIYIIGILLSFALVYYYNLHTPLGASINKLLTYRLFFSSSYAAEYGFPLFGQEIYSVSSVTARLSGTTYSGVDMSYILLPIQYGVIYTIGFIGLFTFIAHRLVQNKMYRELMFIIYFAIAGFSSNVMIQFYRNFSLIFFWIVLKKQSYKD